MPIYEYRCQSCGAELEKLQKISDPVLVECPECGNDTLVKLVSASSFRLKGGGWYESDFKTGKKKNVATDSDSVAGSDKTADVAASASNSGNSASSAKKEDAAKPAKESSSNKPGGSGNQSAAV